MSNVQGGLTKPARVIGLNRQLQWATHAGPRLALCLALALGAIDAVPTAYAQSQGNGLGGFGGQPSDAALQPQQDADPAVLFRDAVNFIRLGRFQIASNFIDALLARSPDPRQLQELAEVRYPDSIDLLITASRIPAASASALKLLDAIKAGQQVTRTDPQRIERQIRRLAESPRAFDAGLRELQVSGEYAVPYMLYFLSQPDARTLHPYIIRALPRLGLPAVGPLVAALASEDNVLRQQVMDALGRIGYPQALPYLKQMAEDDTLSEDVRATARNAIEQITRGRLSASASAAELFYQLAESYYYDRGSLRADRQFPDANVWFYDEGRDPPKLYPVAVPVDAFNDIMAMRASENALGLETGMDKAIALWLAANFQRASDLGDAADATKPEDYPPPAFFARAAGPEYNYMVLSRGLKDNNAAVALGAIRALQTTDGSPTETSEQKLPLVQALREENRSVRIEAALAIASALPRSRFPSDQEVVPVLGEALLLTGRQSALVIHEGDVRRNTIASELRSTYNVETGFDAIEGIGRARANLPGVDVVIISAGSGGDASGAGLRSGLDLISDDPFFAGASVVILAEENQRLIAQQEAELAPNRVVVDYSTRQIGDILLGISKAEQATGRRAFQAEAALQYALDAAQALYALAFSGNQILDFTQARNGLIAALNRTESEPLQIRSAEVLALDSSEQAQRALATIALADGATPTLRVATFNSLAESAKRFGNKLTEEQTQAVINAVETLTDQDVRVAASRALGAMNLPANLAGTLIRNQTREK